jgi:hypothetical protein
VVVSAVGTLATANVEEEDADKFADGFAGEDEDEVASMRASIGHNQSTNASQLSSRNTDKSASI